MTYFATFCMGEAEVYVGCKYVQLLVTIFFKFVLTDELIDNIAFLCFVPFTQLDSIQGKGWKGTCRQILVRFLH